MPRTPPIGLPVWATCGHQGNPPGRVLAKSVDKKSEADAISGIRWRKGAEQEDRRPAPAVVPLRRVRWLPHVLHRFASSFRSPRETSPRPSSPDRTAFSPAHFSLFLLKSLPQDSILASPRLQAYLVTRWTQDAYPNTIGLVRESRTRRGGST